VTKILTFKGSTYRIVFDEYGTLDTIERDGKPISSRDTVARKINANADSILRGMIPAGFTK
jgi:hypothetical protein